MTSHGAGVASPRLPAVAVLTVLVWAAAAVASRWFGTWLAVGTTSAALGATTLALAWRDLRPLLALRTRPLLAGLVVGLAMTALTYILYPAFERSVPGLAHDLDLLYSRFHAAPQSWRWAALLPIVAGEELVWRGLVPSALARRPGVLPVTVTSAALYAAAQCPVGSPLLVFIALACGLVWGSLRIATRGLWAPFLAHVIWDAAVLLIAPVAGGHK